MGQYYNAVIETNNNKEVFYPWVDGEYMMAKLMEHSYWANPFVLAVASKLWRTKGRLAWVGDYAGDDDFNWNDMFVDAHNDDASKDLTYNGFRLEGKYFINHSKRMIIDLDEYEVLLKKAGTPINPISLLTAVGNGKGGGDFRGGIGSEHIGAWAWDVVEIVGSGVYEWRYDNKIRDWTRVLNADYSDYTDVTEEYLFVENR